MPNQEQFPAIFARLKAILQPYAGRLAVTEDGPLGYCLGAPGSPSGTLKSMVAAVYIKKSYVSYHLMAVYAFPDLLTGLSDQLNGRMQGKSCFNFIALDDALVDELTQLTAAGFARFRTAQSV